MIRIENVRKAVRSDGRYGAVQRLEKNFLCVIVLVHSWYIILYHSILKCILFWQWLANVKLPTILSYNVTNLIKKLSSNSELLCLFLDHGVVGKKNIASSSRFDIVVCSPDYKVEQWSYTGRDSGRRRTLPGSSACRAGRFLCQLVEFGRRGADSINLDFDRWVCSQIR